VESRGFWGSGARVWGEGYLGAGFPQQSFELAALLKRPLKLRVRGLMFLLPSVWGRGSGAMGFWVEALGLRGRCSSLDCRIHLRRLAAVIEARHHPGKWIHPRVQGFHLEFRARIWAQGSRLRVSGFRN
jgi:hypothetical protein